jgi:hypothetical protein
MLRKVTAIWTPLHSSYSCSNFNVGSNPIPRHQVGRCCIGGVTVWGTKAQAALVTARLKIIIHNRGSTQAVLSLRNLGLAPQRIFGCTWVVFRQIQHNAVPVRHGQILSNYVMRQHASEWSRAACVKMVKGHSCRVYDTT